jgi:hypothetical protein
MCSAYLRSLEKMQPPPASKPKVQSLEERFLAWFNSLRNSPVIGHSRCGSLKLHSVVRGASSAQYSCVLGGSGSGGGSYAGGNITDTGEAPFRPG